VYCDPAYMADCAARREPPSIDRQGAATGSCSAASAEANFVELGIL
jgi:hypothetical protein